MSGNDERPVSVIKKIIDFETTKACIRQLELYLRIREDMHRTIPIEE